MCSIAGIITFSREINAHDQQALNSLLVSMAHRGPDAQDMRAASNNTLLGSNRLAITDALNTNANMPMQSPDGRFTLIFNGEIYNHNNLRETMPAYPYKTNSDGETLLAAYAHYGSSAVNRLEGMYAFAIHDTITNTVFFATDPSGQKTVYFHGLNKPTTQLVFASEIDALIQDQSLEKHWNKRAISEYISQRFIIGQDTHITEISKLMPGSQLTIGASGELHYKTFFTIPIGDQKNQNIEAISTRIRQSVENACQRTANLEVKPSLLLSGGVDSTAILHFLPKQNKPLNTFSIGFNLQQQDTTPVEFEIQDYDYAANLAQHYNTQHHAQLIDTVEYLDALDAWTDVCGEPLGSQEAPCLMRLLQNVQAEQCKVVFTGSGPDELFDGYSYGAQMSLKTNDIKTLPASYVDTFHWSGNVDLKKLLPNQHWRTALIQKYSNILDQYKTAELSILQATQLMHFHGRLAAYECRQMDLISMRHSVEARAPLLDGELITAAFDFDPSLKQLNGSEKGIFKTGLKAQLPHQITSRKKGAFPIMKSIWSSPEFEQRARILFNKESEILRHKIVNENYMKEIWQSPESRNIFSRLYTLEKIMRRQSRYIME